MYIHVAVPSLPAGLTGRHTAGRPPPCFIHSSAMPGCSST